MPILVDLSQVAISNLMTSPNIKKNQVDSLLIQHMILNSIRGYNSRFRETYGQMVICCDSKHYWRRDIFPHYKGNRKKNRDESGLDWKEVFSTITQMKESLREHFPYKVLEIDGAEADDLIAIIAKNETNPTLIVGSDKDYAQLHSHAHVKQYSSRVKKMLTFVDPKQTLNEHVITGDKGDGIPNIKSASNVFMVGKRQTQIRAVDLAKWSKLKPEHFCENRAMLENYNRNRELIDFDFIPQELQDRIMQAYGEKPLGSKTKVMMYLAANKMRNLLQDVDQF